MKRHREIQHPSEHGLDRFDDEADGEEDEELIEPGHEEQFVPVTVAPAAKKGEEEEEEEEEEKDEDLASNEGDLEIAETSADSGINSSMDQSINQSL